MNMVEWREDGRENVEGVGEGATYLTVRQLARPRGSTKKCCIGLCQSEFEKKKKKKKKKRVASSYLTVFVTYQYTNFL